MEARGWTSLCSVFSGILFGGGFSMKVKGSITIEASFVIPLFLLVFMVSTYCLFYSHDKSVVGAVAYETVSVASGREDIKVEEIEAYIKSIGLYKSKAKNMKKCCQQIIESFDGEVPMTVEELVQLAGVGRKSATLYLADAYNIPGVTVDTHVLRIAKRLGWAQGNNPVQVEKELMAVLPKENWNRINFQLIYHGRELCSARKCHCEKCCLSNWCEKIK